VEVGAAEGDLLHSADCVQRAYFDQGELFDVVVADEDVVFVAAEAGGPSVYGYDISLLILGLVGAQELFLGFGDFDLGKV
jgi:hypothetical protein